MSNFAEFLNSMLNVATDIYNTKQEMERITHCKPIFLGKAHWSNNIYEGSNDNVVRLKNGDVVIAGDGDCVEYMLDRYRWDGKKWERLG